MQEAVWLREIDGSSGIVADTRQEFHCCILNRLKKEDNPCGAAESRSLQVHVPLHR